MKIDDIMDVAELDRLVAEKYIAVKRHPWQPFRIMNYTPKAQFEKVWTPETEQCRGLIIDDDNEIVARPFRKFFSVDQHLALGRPLPTGRFEMYEKLDGSLGILYPHVAGRSWQFSVASRGSFTSTQAVEATAMLQTMAPKRWWDHILTYLVEIIYPENRIVCDYGERRELVLIGAIDNRTGADIPLWAVDWPGRKARMVRPCLPASTFEEFDPETIRKPQPLYADLDFSTVQRAVPDEEEGYVIRYANGLRLKIKGETYKQLHRLLTGVTARDVWEQLRGGKPIEGLLDRVPDEFMTWLRRTSNDLTVAYVDLERAALDAYFDIVKPAMDVPGGDMTRAEFARAVAASPFPHKAVLFKMWDDADHSDLIWRLIKPKADKPFRCGDDG